MNIPLYKQGFLPQEMLQLIKDRVGNFGVAEEHVQEAIQDMEMTVYLKWLLHWFNQLDDQGKRELRQYLVQHKDAENPLLDLLLSKFTKLNLEANIPTIVNQVINLQ